MNSDSFLVEKTAQGRDRALFPLKRPSICSCSFHHQVPDARIAASETRVAQARSRDRKFRVWLNYLHSFRHTNYKQMPAFLHRLAYVSRI